MNRDVPSLADVQAWMQRRLMQAPSSESAEERDWAVPEIITRSSRLSAEERLAVYGNAYFARLLDCLRLEFPAVRHAAGDEAFDGLAWGYLQAQPSRSYTLNELGRGFSGYLQATRPPKEPTGEPDFADFLIDLARLERTYSEVFDAPGPERRPALTADRIQQVGPEEFVRSRLVFYDTVRLLSLRFPCHEFATAVRSRREAVPPPPAITELVIFRRSYMVRRMALPPAEFRILSALWDGSTVEQALRTALSTVGCEIFPGAVARLFADWTAAELFRDIRPTETPLP